MRSKCLVSLDIRIFIPKFSLKTSFTTLSFNRILQRCCFYILYCERKLALKLVGNVNPSRGTTGANSIRKRSNGCDLYATRVLGQGRTENCNSEVDIFFGYAHGGLNTHHVSMESTLADENSHILTIFPDRDEFLGRQRCL